MTKHKAIAVLDIGNVYTKLLVASTQHNEEGDCLLNNVDGFLEQTKGVYGSGVKDKRKLAHTIQALLQKATRQGHTLDTVSILFSHPSIRSETKSFSKRIRDQVSIDEDMLTLAREKQRRVMQKQYPQEDCLEVIITSIVADGSDVTSDPDGVIVEKHLAMEFVCLLAQKKMQDTLYDIINPIIDVDEFIPPHLAFSTLLSDELKSVGVVMMNVGAETTNVVVWKDSLPVACTVIPFGTNTIANIIALKKKMSITEAQQIIHHLLQGDAPLTKTDTKAVQTEIKKHLKPIDVFLKDVDGSKAFPGGIVLTGGGAILFEIDQLIKSVVGLYAEVYHSDTKPLHIVTKEQLPVYLWHQAYGGIQYMCDKQYREMHSRQSLLGSFWNFLSKIFFRASKEIS